MGNSSKSRSNSSSVVVLMGVCEWCGVVWCSGCVGGVCSGEGE